jgi:hypothetical protein
MDSMTTRKSSRKILAIHAALLAFCAGLAGCEGASRAHVPTGSTARESLDAALAAWKSGKTPEAVAALTPAVHAVDSHWQAGRSLASYEILQEEPGESERRFTVRLTEADPKAKAKGTEKEVTYVVIGRGPVYVYRDADYTRFLNMDNNPQPARKPASTPGRPR